MRALGHKAAISALLFSLAASALDTDTAGTNGKRVVLGQTYAIVEPDMRAEIEQRGAQAQARFQAEARRRPIDAHSAFRSVDLPAATRTQARSFDPTYTLPQDIRDADGKVLFAKGTQVNAYDRVTMPGRFIVIGAQEAHYRWLDEIAKPGDADIVLLAGGNVAQVRKDRGLKVYLLDERGVERLGLQAVPAIVRQYGRMLRVDEYALDEVVAQGEDDEGQQ